MNALLRDWDGPFALPPFAQIKDDDFAAAFDLALATARDNIAAIAACPEAPSFDNTIAAMELAEDGLDRLSSLFFNLASADSTDLRESLQRELAPKLSAYSSEIVNNKALFGRIEQLWADRDGLGLTPEQARVLYLYHQMFIRAGAQLTGKAAERLTEVKARLAVLGTTFSQNLLAEERGWFMPLTDSTGLPDDLQEASRAAGQAMGASGPIITLSRSLIVPFLEYCPNRALREKAFTAWAARGANGNAHDNRAIAAEMLALRHERARALGYASFADYKLAPEMAQTPDQVRALLSKVWEPARKKALEDAATLEAMLHQDGETGPLQPWDWRYYSRIRKAALHDLDAAALKKYFSLESILAAQFDCAARLFGLDFTPLDIPLYHPDARAWEVTRAGQHIAVFIGDYFARPSKRSGAWCSALRSQRKLGGDQRPVVLNICNFAKGAPALLSHDDARTLFHEFGHALHQMLSNVTYGFISGTSVARDFVELPSQLYEHWLDVPQVLEKHARHVETQAPMPADMIQRLLAAGSYDQGFATTEFIASAMVDLAFHEGAPPADPMQMQSQVLDALGMPKAITMRHATPHFAHVFSSDGYAAGYYSYMWSEVMDADAFAAFIEAGDVFDPATAARLEKYILSAGGSEPADVLYTKFRGKMPDVAPLLKGRGLQEV